MTDSHLRTVEGILSQAAGGPTTIRSVYAITDGWSAAFAEYPWVARCVVDSPPGWDVASVVVKTRRPANHPRANDAFGREPAALSFLQEIGSDAGPRVLAHDDGLGLVVLEDLGTGNALEDLLVGDDPHTATAGFVALAKALARMHADTLGHQDSFYGRLRDQGISLEQDRAQIANRPLTQWWSAVRDLAERQDVLPATGTVAGDVGVVISQLAGQDSLLALSNGDLAPQNCRIGARSARLLDFESAQFQHLLLDAAHLRLPFYGAPCWSRIPAEVGNAVERAYYDELVAAHPNLLDADTYASGMAGATAAWAIVRLTGLPKLLVLDRPHPMGYSRRGQLLDTLQVAVDAASTSGTLPELCTWFEESIAALRRRWPHLPVAQPVYPAYRTLPLPAAETVGANR